jgi:hypothetical protein
MDSRESIRAAGIGLAIIMAILVSLVVAVLMCWPAMLMFGVVHGFYTVVPAFGLWQTFLVMILVRLVVGIRGPANVNT